MKLRHDRTTELFIKHVGLQATGWRLGAKYTTHLYGVDAIRKYLADCDAGERMHLAFRPADDCATIIADAELLEWLKAKA